MKLIIKILSAIGIVLIAAFSLICYFDLRLIKNDTKEE